MNDLNPVTPPKSECSNGYGQSSSPLTATLSRAESALQTGVGAESLLVGRLQALRRRLKHGRLQLAVLGQFKRGKSTFINALLGADVLPTGVVPLTAIATFIAWRREPLVRVDFKERTQKEEFSAQSPQEIRNTLFRFVAEEANPENRLGIEQVNLFYPADILADGTVIIDTPGVGSTLQHNTQAALRVLPECDAAFFVISPDPPITEVELDYLRGLRSKTTRIFFVLNKADYLQPEDRHRIMEFLQKVLSEKSLIEIEGRIFCISARDALTAKQSADGQALEASGVAALEEHLLRTLASEKRRWLDEAVRCKAADILAQASAELGLRIRTLKLPIEELAEKSESFQTALQSIEYERRITRDLLAGEHRRLRDALDSRIDGLRKETAAKLSDVIDKSLSDAVPMTWEEMARRALSEAMQREFEAAREPLTSAFADDTGASLRRCQDRVSTLVDRIRQTAAEIFDVPLGPAAEQQAFELGEDPYWVTESTRLSLIPDASRLIDRIFPASLRRPRLRSRMIRQAEELIVRNGENLRWAILRGLDETFRQAASQFEERLDETIAATRNVIEDALMRRRDRSFAVQPEIERLASATGTLISLRGEL
jgi:GTPase Era involved in 16S rRNA processing